MTETVIHFAEQTGVTATSNPFILAPGQEASVAVLLTAGTPVTGARVQISLDTPARIMAGTAAWIDSPLGNRTASGAEKLLRPVSAVRVVATDGTWTVQARQG